MQAGEFTPTAHSKVTYNEAFRANQYAGAGVMPIYQLSESFQLRGEFYGFVPIFPIKKDEYWTSISWKSYHIIQISWRNLINLLIIIRFYQHLRKSL